MFSSALYTLGCFARTVLTVFVKSLIFLLVLATLFMCVIIANHKGKGFTLTGKKKKEHLLEKQKENLVKPILDTV